MVQEAQALAIPLPSEAVRQTMQHKLLYDALRNTKRKVCGQELRLVLLRSSHESSWPKLLAVQLQRERLRFCPHAPVRRTANPATDGPAGAAEQRHQRSGTWMSRREILYTQLRRRRCPAPAASCIPHAPRAPGTAHPRFSRVRTTTFARLEVPGPNPNLKSQLQIKNARVSWISCTFFLYYSTIPKHHERPVGQSNKYRKPQRFVSEHPTQQKS